MNIKILDITTQFNKTKKSVVITSKKSLEKKNPISLHFIKKLSTTQYAPRILWIKYQSIVLRSVKCPNPLPLVMFQ